MRELGSKISVCRQNKNMTQEILANKLGVTPQAVSKWERGIGAPDILCLKSLCGILDCSADYLLGLTNNEINEKSLHINEEIGKNIANCLESLELIFGSGLVPLFLDERFKDELQDIRKRLSREGMIVPIMRIRDEGSLKTNEFMLLASGNVLYDEETAEEIDLTYIMQKTEHTVRERYFEILNIDIMKQLIEQLKSTHPALIEGVVPEQFSYALLTRISRQMLQRGNGMRYLPKIIEALQFCFMEQNSREISLLCEYVAGYIEREDNFYVYMEKRKNY